MEKRLLGLIVFIVITFCIVFIFNFFFDKYFPTPTYYADSTESVKDLVDLIGSNKAIIIFEYHDGINTDYIFRNADTIQGNDETIPANIILKFQNGARISVGAGETLTINGLLKNINP